MRPRCKTLLSCSLYPNLLTNLHSALVNGRIPTGPFALAIHQVTYRAELSDYVLHVGQH